MLKIFFPYTGAKLRLSAYFPKPLSGYPIIEPFSGSAGYSTRFHEHKIILNDLSPFVFGIWSYLIKAKASEIRRLPINIHDSTIIKAPQEARWLIGLWFCKGAAKPRKYPSSWMSGKTSPNSFWGETIRERIASQVDLIRHWKISQKNYEDIPNQKATWYIDPPYQYATRVRYPVRLKDFNKLAAFCRSRSGLSIVSEMEPATWLPFKPIASINDIQQQKYTEVLWVKK